MIGKKVWLAIVEVEPLKGNEFIDKAGAYVNVACLADTEINFISKLHFYFDKNKFKVLDIDEMQTEEILVNTNSETPEKLQLINEINEGYEFAWGTFHIFDK